MATEQELSKIVTALRNKLVVTGIYQGYPRVMCPSVLGYKNGLLKGLFYQHQGTTETELPPEGQWLCVVLDGLSDLEVERGLWCMPTNPPRTCIDEIIEEAD
jgi:hypothetical protein